MHDFTECDGFLFIGDPHLSSRKPGRRKDEDFLGTIFGKLEFIRAYCNERKLVPVFLGDMFDTPVEKTRLINRTIRHLSEYWTLPVGNVGNHDIANAALTDDDALMSVWLSGVIQLAPDTGPLGTFKVAGKKIGLGATPYGQPIPTDARGYFDSDVEMIIWLTHHDLLLEDPYPGAAEPHEIKGCKLAVNGHMHLTKPWRPVGKTIWFNPGNINRQYVDALDHVPCVYAFTAAGKLEKIIVPHEKAVFDLTGKLIDPVSPGEPPKPGPLATMAEDSVFVDLLKADDALDMKKSDDGSILMEEIEEKFERDRTPKDLKALILDIHRTAIEGASR